MAFITTPIEQITYAPNEPDHAGVIYVFEDLVAVLSYDNTLYIPPRVTQDYRTGSPVINAARSAGLTHIVVEDDEASGRDERATPEHLVTNYLSFDTPSISREVQPAFDSYLEACRAQLSDNALQPYLQLGETTGVEHAWLNAVLLRYHLDGKLASPDNRDLLKGPTDALHLDLQCVAGRIRSVNGILYASSITPPST
jgi:hypothetical protein